MMTKSLAAHGLILRECRATGVAGDWVGSVSRQFRWYIDSMNPINRIDAYDLGLPHCGFAAAAPPPPGPRNEPPVWATRHDLRLELGTMELRDFSVRNAGVPALICAPFALHYPTVADFAPGHSVVEALRHGGVRRIFVTDWRSASEEMRFLTIDNYLADLNVAVDDLGSDDLGS
jgi:hypothetical protein